MSCQIKEFGGYFAPFFANLSYFLNTFVSIHTSMPRQKKKYPHCPCCSTDKDRMDMTVCISLLDKLERKLYKNYNELNLDPYIRFIGCSFEWACDNCLRDKKAILASPGLQQYAWDPNLAYHDTNLVCRTCKTDFKFTKEEKLLWYEKLKFWISSAPINCLKCRKQVRVQKLENKTLSEILLKDENELTIDDLKTISDIYRKWENIDKAKFYDALARKRLKKEKQE